VDVMNIIIGVYTKSPYSLANQAWSCWVVWICGEVQI